MRLILALAAVLLSSGSVSAHGRNGGDGGSGPSSSGPSGYGPGSPGSGFGSGPAGYSIPFGGDREKAERVMLAHGVLACLAFVVFFPFGAISIRLFSFPGLVWFHAIFQMLAYLLFTAAFGLGIYLATQIRRLNDAHPIIGIVLFVLIFFQPFLGFIHHRLFKKYQRRTFWSHAHIWLGRAIITLGLINGGLGLQLANNTRNGEIAYGVLAGIVWLVYIVSIFVGEAKRRKNRESAVRAEAEPKRHESDGPGLRTNYYA